MNGMQADALRSGGSRRFEGVENYAQKRIWSRFDGWRFADASGWYEPLGGGVSIFIPIFRLWLPATGCAIVKSLGHLESSR